MHWFLTIQKLTQDGQRDLFNVAAEAPHGIHPGVIAMSMNNVRTMDWHTLVWYTAITASEFEQLRSTPHFSAMVYRDDWTTPPIGRTG